MGDNGDNVLDDGEKTEIVIKSVITIAFTIVIRVLG
jgi:hypothetical protein|tara:strand:- start:1 stop:108 length:108 start_codon:yes stop_codon:yes gene_type:complete